MSFGPVRTISENLKTMGLISQKPVNESEKEKIEKKRLIEEARRARQPKKVEAPSKPIVESKKEAPAKKVEKTRLEKLLEEVETLSQEVKTVVTEAPSQKMRTAIESLEHMQKVSEAIVKKYDWRMDEKSQNIAELFKQISNKTTELHKFVYGNDLAEADKTREDVNGLVKRFVKAVGFVKEDLSIDDEVFTNLKQEAEKIK